MERTATFRATLRSAIITSALFPISQAAAQISSTVEIPPDLAVRSPGGVNMVDGQYSDGKSHLAISDTASGGFELQRVFKKNSAPVTNWHYEIKRRGTSTDGWHLSIENSGTAATFFSFTGDPPYQPVSLSIDGGLSSLERFTSGSNKYFIYTAPDGRTIRFQASADGLSQYAEEIKQTNGLIYNFFYDVSGETRLRRIKSNAGYELIFEYLASPNQAKISKVCALNLSRTISPSSPVCPTGEATVSYTYSGNRIASITDPLGATITITNNFVGNTAPFQENFYKPGYAQPYLINSYQLDTEGPMGLYVAQQTFGDGLVLTYEVTSFGAEFPTIVSRLSRWTENGTSPTVLEWGAYQKDYRYKPAITPGPVTVTDPLNRKTRTEYSGNYRRIISRTQPSGMKEQYAYNANGSITQRTLSPPPGSPEVPVTVSYTYDCTVAINCKKPATMTDAKGNVTNYVYDATHGGLLSEMLPPPAAGAARPLTVNTYVQKYAYVKNSAGALVPAATPIWVQATATQCQAVAGTSPAPVCDSGAVQTVTTYEYGADGAANTLLLRGKVVTADGVSLRTCYGYDALGNRISETEPRAGLTSCP